jgi:hypothetical protein
MNCHKTLIGTRALRKRPIAKRWHRKQFGQISSKLFNDTLQHTSLNNPLKAELFRNVYRKENQEISRNIARQNFYPSR